MTELDKLYETARAIGFDDRATARLLLDAMGLWDHEHDRPSWTDATLTN